VKPLPSAPPSDPVLSKSAHSRGPERTRRALALGVLTLLLSLLSSFVRERGRASERSARVQFVTRSCAAQRQGPRFHGSCWLLGQGSAPRQLADLLSSPEMEGGRPALDANKGNYAVDLLMVVYGLHTKVYYPKPEGWKLGDLIKAQHFQQVIHEGLQDGSVTAAAPAGPRESHPLFKDLSGRPWHRLKCQTVAAYRRILTTAVKRYNADPNVRAPTTEKSFGKNLRTFGLTLDEGEKAFTFDLAKWQNHCNRVLQGGVTTQGSSPLVNEIEVPAPPRFYSEFGRTTARAPTPRQQEKWRCSPVLEVPGFGKRVVSFVLKTEPSLQASMVIDAGASATEKKRTTTTETKPAVLLFWKDPQATDPAVLDTPRFKRPREFCADEPLRKKATFLADREKLVIESARRGEIRDKIFGLSPEDASQENREMAAFVKTATEKQSDHLQRSEDFLDLNLIQTQKSADIVIKPEPGSVTRAETSPEFVRARQAQANEAQRVRNMWKAVDAKAIRAPTVTLFSEAERDILRMGLEISQDRLGCDSCDGCNHDFLASHLKRPFYPF